MFDLDALNRFYDLHSTLPHVSKYHRETYFQHCWLVIGEALKRTQDSSILLAAAVHDIAKPRTQGLNKVDEPCFYGHEEVTDEELTQFVTRDDPRYDYVKALVYCHMHPYKCENAKDYYKAIRKECRKSIKKAGVNIEVTDDFIRDVEILHAADDAGSIRKDEDLIYVQARIDDAVQNIKVLK